ncbi:MAG: hypothetical protein ACYCDI_07745 [Corynebacterium aurimucosum]
MSSTSSTKRTKSFVIAAVFIVLAVASLAVGRGGDSLLKFNFFKDTTLVTGAISPELEATFKDPAMLEALEKHNIEVELDVVPAGDFVEHSSSVDKDYDFILTDPNGAAWVSDLRNANPELAELDEGSPMVFGNQLLVLVHSELVEDMKDHDLVTESGNLASLNVETLVDMSQENTRWRDISPAFGSPRVVDVAVPQVSQSFAALRYARLLRTVGEYYAQKELGRDDKAKIDAEADDIMRHLVAEQGYSETTEQGILDAFLRVDKGEMPMVLATTDQYVRLLHEGEDLSRYTPLALDPPTTLISIVIPRTEEGALFAKAMNEDGIPAVMEGLGLSTQGSGFNPKFDPSNDHSIPVDGGEYSQLRWADFEEILQVVG